MKVNIDLVPQIARAERSTTVIALAIEIMRVLGEDTSDDYADLLALQSAIADAFIAHGASNLRDQRYQPGDDKADRIQRDALLDEIHDLVLRFWEKAWEDDPHTEPLPAKRKKGKRHGRL